MHHKVLKVSFPLTRRKVLLTSLPLTLTLAGCRTLDPGAEKIAVVQKPPADCKNLGLVNVDWSWWGASTEGINAMRNQVKDLGGDTLSMTSASVGMAYDCSANTTR